MTELNPAGEAEITPKELVAGLSKKQVRILGLVGLGWSDADIAHLLFVSASTVSSHISRAKVRVGQKGGSREAIALFYVRHILPTDIEPNYTEPGEKLLDWRRRARQIRAELRATGVLTDRVVEAAMLLANPENVDKTDDELAALMRGSKELPAGFFSLCIIAAISKIPKGSRLRLVVIATLAPFNEDD